MIKIHLNSNKQNTTLSCSAGQPIPKVDGKLVSIELSGKELLLFMNRFETPIVHAPGMIIVWTGRFTGRALNALRELFDGN